MKKSNKMLISGASFLIAVYLLITYFPKDTFFYRLFNIVREDTVRISNIDIKLTKQWLTLSDEDPIVIGSEDGTIGMWFSVIENNEKKIENHKNSLESSNVPTEREIIQRGCSRCNALKFQMVGPNNNQEVYEIAFEPDLIIHVNLLEDNDLKKRQEIIRNFLANNVMCIEDSHGNTVMAR